MNTKYNRLATFSFLCRRQSQLSHKLRVASPHATQTKTARVCRSQVRISMIIIRRSPRLGRLVFRPHETRGKQKPPSIHPIHAFFYWLAVCPGSRASYAPPSTRLGVSRPINRANPHGYPPRDDLALKVCTFAVHPGRRSDIFARFSVRTRTLCYMHLTGASKNTTPYRRRFRGAMSRQIISFWSLPQNEMFHGARCAREGAGGMVRPTLERPSDMLVRCWRHA